MTDDVKSDVWDIEVEAIVIHRGVVFEKPMTKDEAIDAFLDEEYADILDYEEGGIIRIRDVTPK